jgi:hypothetical protein
MYGVDVADVGEVHIVFRELLEDLSIVNCFWSEVFVSLQLCRAEDCESDGQRSIREGWGGCGAY